jgi:hypothetical protein
VLLARVAEPNHPDPQRLFHNSLSLQKVSFGTLLPVGFYEKARFSEKLTADT